MTIMDICSFCVPKKGVSECVDGFVESYSHWYGVLVALSILIIRKLNATTSTKWIGFPIVEVKEIKHTCILMGSKLPLFCGPMLRKYKKVWYHSYLTTNLHLLLCSGQSPRCCCWFMPLFILCTVSQDLAFFRALANHVIYLSLSCQQQWNGGLTCYFKNIQYS